MPENDRQRVATVDNSFARLQLCAEHAHTGWKWRPRPRAPKARVFTPACAAHASGDRTPPRRHHCYLPQIRLSCGSVIMPQLSRAISFDLSQCHHPQPYLSPFCLLLVLAAAIRERFETAVPSSVSDSSPPSFANASSGAGAGGSNDAEAIHCLSCGFASATSDAEQGAK